MRTETQRRKGSTSGPVRSRWARTGALRTRLRSLTRQDIFWRPNCSSSVPTVGLLHQQRLWPGRISNGYGLGDTTCMRHATVSKALSTVRFGCADLVSQSLLVTRLAPSLTIRARFLKQPLPHHLLLRLKALVELILVFIACARESAPIPNLLVTALERQYLFDTLRVVMQRQRRMHAVRPSELAGRRRARERLSWVVTSRKGRGACASW